MNIIALFDNYFLILMIIQGLVSLIIDTRNFKNAGMYKSYKQSRVIGILSIFISVIIYSLVRIFA
ncbi:CLC_0170 family protein [Clostridium rectalis]|uniref:CLC_0170 family protein n=1 Tax=Clostridium rectalis TaxID=2040295 RepID=UPI000F64505C|nr:CLC_0170 family protein [Clostridium rectalis]